MIEWSMNCNKKYVEILYKNMAINLDLSLLKDQNRKVIVKQLDSICELLEALFDGILEYTTTDQFPPEVTHFIQKYFKQGAYFPHRKKIL